MRRCAIPMAVVAALCAPASSSAQTATLTADRDNTMLSNDASKSNGAGQYLFAGRTEGGDLRRSLVRFDVAAIPPGVTVTEVTLTLSMSRTIVDARDVTLHRVLADWGEGTSDASGMEGEGDSATPGDATWSHRRWETDLWSTPGGDRVPSPSAATAVDASGFYSWTGPGLVADVQAWIDGGGNHGWMIVAESVAGTTAKRFDSRDHRDSGRRPRLVVRYTVPPPTGACCAADGGCSEVDDPGVTCVGSYLGAGVACDPDPCPTPTGACCSALGACSVVDAPGAACAGTWLGAGTTCEPDPCTTPTGACCADDGGCTTVDHPGAGCTGSYMGLGVACDPSPCPIPTGACCSALGACSVVAHPGGACAGTYLGRGTACDVGACPIPTGACCSALGACSVVDAPGTSCAGTWLGVDTSCVPDPCPTPTGACCSTLGACSIVDAPGAACAGSFQGAGTTCDPDPCPTPTGACCRADGTCRAVLHPGAGCSGTYLGAATVCTPDACPEVTGACCEDRACTLVAAPGAACGGDFLGAGSACDPDPCVAPTGACCATDGSCTVVADPGDACGGTYEGAGTTCAPGTCPAPEGACCEADGCTVGPEDGCAGAFLGAATTCAPDPCRVRLTPFVDELPRPAIATPEEGAPGDAARYRLAIVQIRQQLHRDLPPTTVWGYDDGTTGGTYPGPTIEAWVDRPVTVTWHNDLRDASGRPRDSHFLPVDPCPHGAEEPSARVVTHLHGGHVAAAFDGYPEDTLSPGESAVYEYPNWQPPATIWYHDHALGITRLNVYMGLAGLYLIRDDAEARLGLPAGEHEVPLVIQDRRFRPDGSLDYPAEWQEHFFGDVVLVNGKVWPYLEVERGKYRLRMLNGSNSRVYALSLSTGQPMQQIGSDGGLLPAIVARDEIVLAPGERADVIVDFEELAPGTEVRLRNRAPAPYPGTPGEGVIPDVLEFVVVDRPGHVAPLPERLGDVTALDEADAIAERDFVLRRGDDHCGGRAWFINDLGWDDVTERPALGTTEIWRFVNSSGTVHPMHMHLVFFQVLDRQGVERDGDEVRFVGDPVAAPAWERGWKDTVMVAPHEAVRVIARFEDFVGRFPYHCHILEHEDHEMMRQMETVTTCGDGARGLPDEECDDGNTEDGDGCSAACALEPTPDAGAAPDGSAPDGGTRDAGPRRDAGSSPTDAGTPVNDAGPPLADAGPPLAGGGGCGCRVAGPPTGLAPALVVLLALVARRRRRAVGRG